MNEFKAERRNVRRSKGGYSQVKGSEKIGEHVQW